MRKRIAERRNAVIKRARLKSRRRGRHALVSQESDIAAFESRWVTGPMLRKLFNISAVTLWRWRRGSGFPRGKSINGRLYIPWHEVEAWLQSQPDAA